MKRYAVIISAEKYSNFQPTPFAHADSELIRSVLTNECDYATQHLLHMQLRIEENLSPKNILANIQQTVDGSERGDTILFYFAGHGHFEDNNAYLILPNTDPNRFESTALSLSDISNKLRPSGRACFRLYDACHSGVDVRSDLRKLDPKSFIRSITHDYSDWVTIAACREDEYSYGDPELGHGIFTYYFCEYIKQQKPDEIVLPELIKVEIADKVSSHAKKLGFTQTPTMNARISGNISLATRRIRIHADDKGKSVEHDRSSLISRIAELKKLNDISESSFLREVLVALVDSTKEEFDRVNDLGGPISVSNLISADDIPEEMHQDIVSFIRRQGFQSRHTIERWEEEIEEPLYGLAIPFSSLFRPKKRKIVHYDVRQSRDLPESATIMEFPGDNRCIPSMKILVYVIPLQVTVCLLVSGFRHDWPPNESNLELIHHCYKILRPEMTSQDAKELASYAGKKIMEEFRKYIEKRVEQLEREIK